MKAIKLLLAATLFHWVCLGAVAQQDSLKASDYEKSTAIASRLEQELSLTGRQTEQVFQLALERLNNLKLEDEQNPGRFEKVSQMAIPRLRAILTREQFAKYVELRAESKRQKEEYYRKHPEQRMTVEDQELDF